MVHAISNKSRYNTYLKIEIYLVCKVLWHVTYYCNANMHISVRTFLIHSSFICKLDTLTLLIEFNEWTENEMTFCVQSISNYVSRDSYIERHYWTRNENAHEYIKRRTSLRSSTLCRNELLGKHLIGDRAHSDFSDFRKYNFQSIYFDTKYLKTYFWLICLYSNLGHCPS